MRLLPTYFRTPVFASLFCAATAQATGELEIDVRCLSDAAQAIRLEWHTFSEANAGWFGGYVKYKGATKVIPIVLSSTQTLSRPGGRPWEFRYTWLEVSDSQVTGEYRLSSQGANVYDFSYKNLRTGKQYSFSEVSAPAENGRCAWE